MDKCETHSYGKLSLLPKDAEKKLNKLRKKRKQIFFRFREDFILFCIQWCWWWSTAHENVEDRTSTITTRAEKFVVIKCQFKCEKKRNCYTEALSENIWALKDFLNNRDERPESEANIIEINILFFSSEQSFLIIVHWIQSGFSKILWFWFQIKIYEMHNWTLTLTQLKRL